MKKKNVVVSTLSEEVFEDIENKLEEMGVSVIEERYDLLYHRYEIYVKLNFRQNYNLRHFIKNRNLRVMYLETPSL